MPRIRMKRPDFGEPTPGRTAHYPQRWEGEVPEHLAKLFCDERGSAKRLDPAPAEQPTDLEPEETPDLDADASAEDIAEDAADAEPEDEDEDAQGKMIDGAPENKMLARAPVDKSRSRRV